MIWKKGIMIITGLLLPGFLLANEELHTIQLKVEHLACSSCAEKFKEALSSLCKDLTLDLQKGEALCQYQDPITPKQIVSRANKTGMHTTRLEDENRPESR